jgi:hypothetical protein
MKKPNYKRIISAVLLAFLYVSNVNKSRFRAHLRVHVM